MTAREMVYGLQEQLFNLFGDVIYEIQTVDLLYYLNKAQNQIIKEKVKEFEINQYITDEIRTLVKEATLVPTGTSTKFSITLPDDYNVLVKHYCITTNSCATKRVAGVITQLDDLEILLKNPFWKPSNEDVLYYIIGDKLVYEIPDASFTINSSTITYIKKEQEIYIDLVNNINSVDSELPEYLHEEIINIAADLIIKNKQLNQ